MAKFREQAQRGLSITLTFEAPPKVTGKVLEVAEDVFRQEYPRYIKKK
jgi:hypothetical protein